jgi:hypothetical protein
MSNVRAMKVMAAAAFGIAALNLHGQSTPKPSPYTGVSQPPPDDTITSDATPAQTPTLVTRPAAPAQAVTAPAAASPANTAVTASASGAYKAPCDPDDRMVGDPDPCLQPNSAVVASAKPSPSGDYGMVTGVLTRPGELPEGSVIKIAIDQEIATRESQAGNDFSGRVAADVASPDGKVVIPQGAQVLGKVVQVSQGTRFGQSATVRLRPDVVVLPDGTRYVLRAQVLQTNTKLRVDNEGTVRPASRLKTNAIKEGAGIGTGAIVGAAVGGGPGALVGSLIGAGVMTTNILVQRPATVRIPRNAVLTLSLTQPMSISPEVASNTPGGAN